MIKTGYFHKISTKFQSLLKVLKFSGCRVPWPFFFPSSRSSTCWFFPPHPPCCKQRAEWSIHMCVEHVWSHLHFVRTMSVLWRRMGDIQQNHGTTGLIVHLFHLIDYTSDRGRSCVRSKRGVALQQCECCVGSRRGGRSHSRRGRAWSHFGAVYDPAIWVMCKTQFGVEPF